MDSRIVKAAKAGYADGWRGIALMTGRSERWCRYTSKRAADPLPVFKVGGMVRLAAVDWDRWVNHRREVKKMIRKRMEAERRAVTRVLRVPMRDDAAELANLRELLAAAKVVREGRSRTPPQDDGVAARFAKAVDACLGPTPMTTMRLYVTVGLYEDGSPGEVFLKAAKEGSFPSGTLEALGIAISLGLQNGIPLADYLVKFRATQFEPAGMTGSPDIPIVSSLLDYFAQWADARFCPATQESASAGSATGDRPA